MDIKNYTVDVIIPLYKPDKEFFTLLDKLLEQTIKINNIILFNTEEKYFERLVYGTPFPQKYGKYADVYHISKREFDHARTRRLALTKSNADIFVMMTQDAMPVDSHLLQRLLESLKDEKTAVAYARQLPTQDCNEIEKYTRRFNYPDESRIKNLEDLDNLGIKTYFCSNVCAAYKRNVYDELGGFVRSAIFNEDMIYAAKAIQSGYSVAYAADASVYHSHNYTNMQYFKRNFDLGVSQAEHPEVFKGIPSEREGKKMVSQTTAWLWKTKKRKKVPSFYIQCMFKYIGYFLGKHYRMLPKFIIKRCTSNRQYWENRI